MTLRRALVAILLAGSALVQAGEIIIVQPAGKDSRSEKAAARSAEMAKQRSGRAASPIIIEDGSLDSGSKAQRSSQDAQEYLRSAPPASPDDKTTIILRSAPQSDAEKARQKAASYVQPANSSANSRCGDVALTVGTIGDKTVVEQRNVTVNERGNSAVNVNCRK